MYAAQRDAHTRAINHKNNPAQRCAVTQQPQRDAVQQRTRDDTHPQSQYCGTAPYSLRSRQHQRCTPKKRILHRACDAATILHISQAQRAGLTHMPTSAALPATIARHKHACTDTHDATSPTHHNGTSASWRVSPNTAHTSKPRTAHRTLTHSIQTHTPRTPARRPAQHQQLCTAQTSLHAHRPHTRHTHHGTQLRAPHTPPTEHHTQSHTRPPRHTHHSRVRLPSVDGMLPERLLLLNHNDLQDTRTAITSHHGTRRRRRPQPAGRDASQRIA
jgi:hypothetical protein